MVCSALDSFCLRMPRKLELIFSPCTSHSFPCAFLVLIASTWNIVTSLWAILTVAAIVACVLGSVKALFGWGLGIAESIAAVIVIGLSVDYAVHLAHMCVQQDCTSL